MRPTFPPNGFTRREAGVCAANSGWRVAGNGLVTVTPRHVNLLEVFGQEQATAGFRRRRQHDGVPDSEAVIGGEVRGTDHHGRGRLYCFVGVLPAQHRARARVGRRLALRTRTLNSSPRVCTGSTTASCGNRSISSHCLSRIAAPLVPSAYARTLVSSAILTARRRTTRPGPATDLTGSFGSKLKTARPALLLRCVHSHRRARAGDGLAVTGDDDTLAVLHGAEDLEKRRLASAAETARFMSLVVVTFTTIQIARLVEISVGWSGPYNHVLDPRPSEERECSRRRHVRSPRVPDVPGR